MRVDKDWSMNCSFWSKYSSCIPPLSKAFPGRYWMVRWAMRGAAERVFGCLMMKEPGVRLAEGRVRKSLKRVSWLGLLTSNIPEYGDV